MNNLGGNRMDFIAVHCYLRDPYQFENYITNLHNWRWQNPMWITEFAPADWSGNNPVSTDECARFMKIVVPWLNGHWYVARYAWYTIQVPAATGRSAQRASSTTTARSRRWANSTPACRKAAKSRESPHPPAAP